MISKLSFISCFINHKLLRLCSLHLHTRIAPSVLADFDVVEGERKRKSSMLPLTPAAEIDSDLKALRKAFAPTADARFEAIHTRQGLRNVGSYQVIAKYVRFQHA